MSLPVPSRYSYVTSCPLSLLLCHILFPHSYVNWWHRPLLLWYFLTPLLYVISCPLPSTTCLTKIHTQVSQLRSILEMKDIGLGRERSWRERSSSMASADLMEISRTGIAPQCDPLLKWRWGSAFIPLLGPGIKCRLPVKWELYLGWGNSLQMRSILEERFNQDLWIQHTEDGRWDALILMGSLGGWHSFTTLTFSTELCCHWKGYKEHENVICTLRQLKIPLEKWDIDASLK